MLIPAETQLQGIVGASWDAEIDLFADANQTQPYDLGVAYDISKTELQMDGLPTLKPTTTPGTDGLTITAGTGIIAAYMSPTTTRQARGNRRWRLKLVRAGAGGGVDYPVHGTCVWTSP